MGNTAYGNIAERVAVIGTIDPDAYGTGDQTTDIIDMKSWREVMFVVAVGDIASTGTADFLVKGSAASNMGTPATITGKTITQLTQAGTDSDKQVVVRVTAEEVAAQGYRYIQGTLTLTTAGADATVLVLGMHAHYTRAADYDLSTVDEIVY